MCLGATHTWAGTAIGAAYGGFVMHAPPGGVITLAAFTGALALWPDIDHCGSSVSRSLGLFSRGVAWIVGKATGGHRHATHSCLGIAVTAGLAWIACRFLPSWPAEAFLAVIITFSVSGMLEALKILRSHAADLVAIGVSALVIWRGYGLALIPLAVLLGCSAHVAADMLTDSGCMLGFPFSKRRYHLLPEPAAFTTGTLPERVIAAPVFLLATGLLTFHAFVPHA